MLLLPRNRGLAHFYFFKGNLVLWASKNPSRVMTSSTEVECRGLVAVGTIYKDNTASITMASDLSTPHKRSKHFGIEWSFFKESVEKREIIPIYVSTDEEPADMLTKAWTTHKFAVFREMVMGSQHLQNHFTKNSLVYHWVEVEVVDGQYLSPANSSFLSMCCLTLCWLKYFYFVFYPS